jgi:membrane protein YqaA with SNARE-associated domain
MWLAAQVRVPQAREDRFPRRAATGFQGGGASANAPAMLRSLYDRTMRLAASRHAGWWLGLVAFCEGIFFPIPPDLMLMPMVLARRERAWLYAGTTLVCSVVGGSVGFLIGFMLKGGALWILTHTGVSASGVAAIQRVLQQWGYLLLALPIPYKLIAIAAGMIPLNYPLFLLASIGIRGARFFLVAWLMRAYGPPIQSFIERRLALMISAVAVLVVLALLALKLLLH